MSIDQDRRTYNVKIQLYEAKLRASATTFYDDPYCVAFLTRDREGTKIKTYGSGRARLSKDSPTVFNKHIQFFGVSYEEVIRMELKADRSFAENPLLGVIEFRVSNVLSSQLGRGGCYAFPLVGGKDSNVRADLCMALEIDPPIAADAIAYEAPPQMETLSRQSITIRLEDPVYLHVDTFFSVMLMDATAEA
mmetsp:Transcript_152/g.525  ORF Transcript_152/g.525 Transcript_152/m.525 type:complete len:192 (-) Transcript_152:93-668(-)